MKKIAMCFCCLAMACVTWAQNNLPITPVFDPANPEPYIPVVPKVLPDGYKYIAPMVTMLMDVGYLDSTTNQKKPLLQATFNHDINSIHIIFNHPLSDSIEVALEDVDGNILYQKLMNYNQEIVIDASLMPIGKYFATINYINPKGEIKQLKKTVHLVR